MAAVRSFEAEDVFCEQMVERAQASSFRNRWDRDRLWFWQQRLRATRAAGVTEGGGADTASAVGLEPAGKTQAYSPPSPAPFAAHPEKESAQPKNTAPAPAPAPTLFDKEAA